MSREHGVELRHELVQRHAIGVALEPGREGVRDWDVGTTLSQLGKDFLSLELIFLLADLVLGESLESLLDNRGGRSVRRGLSHGSHLLLQSFYMLHGSLQMLKDNLRINVRVFGLFGEVVQSVDTLLVVLVVVQGSEKRRGDKGRRPFFSGLFDNRNVEK